jgi:hypothetical protein
MTRLLTVLLVGLVATCFGLPTSLISPARVSLVPPSLVWHPSALELPDLTANDLNLLASGVRIQKQDRVGQAGRGSVIFDVPADPDRVFELLSAIPQYDKLIPTVRGVQLFESNDNRIVAEFQLSKFRLKCTVIHDVCFSQRVIRFQLDPDRRNFVLEAASGYWFVEAPCNVDAPYSRVYFMADVVASALIPAYSKWVAYKPYLDTDSGFRSFVTCLTRYHLLPFMSDINSR